MTIGYCPFNALVGVATSAFSWSNAYAMATLEKNAIADGKMSSLATSGTASAAPIHFIIDFGSATSIRGFALLNHNLGDGTWTAPTVRVQCDSASDFSTATTVKAASTIPLLTRGYRTKDTALMFSSGSARYWRLTFAETSGTPNRIVSFGELFAIGTTVPVVSLSRTPIYGEGISYEYLHNEVELSNGDVSRSLRAGPVATRSFTFDDQTEAQRDELLTMWHASQGGVTSLLYIPGYVANSSAATAAEQECMLGRLQPTMGWTQPDYAVFGLSGFELRSRAREIGA